MGTAIAERRKTFVGGELRPAYSDCKPLPKLLFRARDDDPSIARLERLKRHQRRMRGVVGPPRLEFAVEVPNGGICQHRNGSIEKTYVAVHSDAVAPCCVNAGKD